MEVSKKITVENTATLTQKELKILIVLGNSPMIAEILFNHNIGKTLLTYGLTEACLHSFLTGIPLMSKMRCLGMTFEPVEESV